MTATLLYRIASVLLILYAAAHIVGSSTFTPPTPESVAVYNAMNTVHFSDGSRSYSFGDFYKGLGDCVTIFVLFQAFLAWHMATMAAKQPESIGALGWIFCASQLATMVVAWVYIAAPPAISSAVVAVCLALAAWRVRVNPKQTASLQ